MTEENDSHHWNSNINKSSGNAKFFKLSGYISSISDEKCFYLACPDCKKKVVENSTMYRCESCNKSYMLSVPTYMISAKFSDLTGNCFIQFLRETGDHIMNGKTAQEFKDLKEDMSPEEAKEFIYNCTYKV